MSEEIVRDVEYKPPEYVNEEELNDDYAHVNIINSMLDAINGKKAFFQEMHITDTAQVVSGMPEYGAFLVCIEGEISGMPGGVYAYASNGTAATVSSIVAQNGSGDWAGIGLTVAASGGNITVLHGLASTSAKFFISVLGYF